MFVINAQKLISLVQIRIGVGRETFLDGTTHILVDFDALF